MRYWKVPVLIGLAGFLHGCGNEGQASSAAVQAPSSSSPSLSLNASLKGSKGKEGAEGAKGVVVPTITLEQVAKRDLQAIAAYVGGVDSAAREYLAEWNKWEFDEEETHDLGVFYTDKSRTTEYQTKAKMPHIVALVHIFEDLLVGSKVSHVPEDASRISFSLHLDAGRDSSNLVRHIPLSFIWSILSMEKHEAGSSSLQYLTWVGGFTKPVRWTLAEPKRSLSKYMEHLRTLEPAISAFLDAQKQVVDYLADQKNGDGYPLLGLDLSELRAQSESRGVLVAKPLVDWLGPQQDKAVFPSRFPNLVVVDPEIILYRTYTKREEVEKVNKLSVSKGPIVAYNTHGADFLEAYPIVELTTAYKQIAKGSKQLTLPAKLVSGKIKQVTWDRRPPAEFIVYPVAEDSSSEVEPSDEESGSGGGSGGGGGSGSSAVSITDSV